MAYNNMFPVGYQPYYPQQQYMPQQQMQMAQQAQAQPQAQAMTPPTIHAEIVQVDNEQVAESYPLSAGMSQMMIAKDDSAIFVKTMYANGQYNLDVFAKRPNKPKQPDFNPNLYITRDEFESRLKALTEPSRAIANTDKEVEGA